jgi:hypothetical protein
MLQVRAKKERVASIDDDFPPLHVLLDLALKNETHFFALVLNEPPRGTAWRNSVDVGFMNARTRRAQNAM